MAVWIGPSHGQPMALGRTSGQGAVPMAVLGRGGRPFAAPIRGAPSERGRSPLPPPPLLSQRLTFAWASLSTKGILTRSHCPVYTRQSPRPGPQQPGAALDCWKPLRTDKELFLARRFREHTNNTTIRACARAHSHRPSQGTAVKQQWGALGRRRDRRTRRSRRVGKEGKREKR